jgi:hypothetical protein
VRASLPARAFAVLLAGTLAAGLLGACQSPGYAFVVQKTVTDYLPSTLQAYLNLPRAYATVHRFSDGRTAAQMLLDQLTLLDKKLDDVADAVNKNDADALLANGRFLEDRFGGTALNLPPASAPPTS